MADKIHTKIDFEPFKGGTASNDSGYSIRMLDSDNDSVRPYELLLNALGGCLYSTFEEIVRQKRLSFDSVDVDISGIKREEVPMFLKECSIKFTVKGADKKIGFEKAFTLACKYCSIYRTLEHVAEMKPEISFI